MLPYTQNQRFSNFGASSSPIFADSLNVVVHFVCLAVSWHLTLVQFVMVCLVFVTQFCCHHLRKFSVSHICISGDTILPKGKIGDVRSVNASVKAANRERMVQNLLKWHMLLFIKAYNIYIEILLFTVI